jgi:hypothetical protein
MPEAQRVSILAFVLNEFCGYAQAIRTENDLRDHYTVGDFDQFILAKELKAILVPGWRPQL